MHLGADLRRRERVVANARWLAALAVGVQSLLVTPDLRPGLWLVMGGLAVAGVVAEALIRRVRTDGALVRGGALLLAADTAATFGFVAAHVDEPGAVAWVALLLPPIEGAIRFGLAGALAAWLPSAVFLPVLAEVAQERYGHAHEASMTFFQGALLLIVALLAGGFARELRRHIETLRAANKAMADLSGLREPAHVQQGLCRAAVETLGAVAAILYEWDGEAFRPITSAPRAVLPFALEADPPSHLEHVRWERAPEGYRLYVPVRADEEARSLLVISTGDRAPSALVEEAAWALVEAARISLAGLRWLYDEQRVSRRLRYLEELRRHLTATIAHDLRLPLTVFLGVAKVLRANWGEIGKDEADALLGSVERQAKRLSRLADDLLDAARIDADRLILHPEELDVEEVVARVLPDLDHDVSLVVEGDVRMVGDPARLERVVWNLLTNAQRHGALPVELRAVGNPDEVVVEVRDHGPGLPPQRRDSFAEPFAASRDPASVGLGLTIVQQLVEAHGGEVLYEDADPGACFRVRLPRDAGATGR